MLGCADTRTVNENTPFDSEKEDEKKSEEGKVVRVVEGRGSRRRRFAAPRPSANSPCAPTLFLSPCAPRLRNLARLHTLKINENLFTGELPDSFVLLEDIRELCVIQSMFLGALNCTPCVYRVSESSI
jgi:hypothetical protein